MKTLAFSFALYGANIMAQQSPSVFTKIYDEKSEEILLETESFFAIFDNYPVNPGHALVIPKKQKVAVEDLSAMEWGEIHEMIEVVYKRISERDLYSMYKEKRTALESQLKAARSDQAETQDSKKALKRLEKRAFYLDQMMTKLEGFKSKVPTGKNIGINDGRSAGRTIDHLHIHIIPRFDGDMASPEGGVRNIFPELGNYTK